MMHPSQTWANSSSFFGAIPVRSPLILLLQPFVQRPLHLPQGMVGSSPKETTNSQVPPPPNSYSLQHPHSCSSPGLPRCYESLKTLALQSRMANFPPGKPSQLCVKMFSRRELWDNTTLPASRKLREEFWQKFIIWG